MINFFQRYSLLFLLFALPLEHALGQCFNPVLHPYDTKHVGCTEVTVSSAGETDTYGNSPFPCAYGPYWIGIGGPGSVTFTFWPAVNQVSIDVGALDNTDPLAIEDDIALEVNGSFYPMPSPGTPDGCWAPAIIWPPGTLRGPVGGQGSTKDIIISQSMTSLTVENLGYKFARFSLYICCGVCQTDAGEITADPLNLCGDDLASVPPSEQTLLNIDDLLQYILFSDPADTIGSILAISDLPEFTFDPATMSYSVTYYIAAIAGNGLGGIVNLYDDPCLDISNAIEVVWHPEPTVTFFAPNTEICSGGCQFIEATFTGTPPFQLSGEVLSGTNIISTFSETYLSSNGVLTVCLPPDTALGSLDINAMELTDSFCTCD